jgi:multiple sugar transport system permease protein
MARSALLHTLLLVGALLVLLPYLWMVSSSLKSDADIFQVGLNLLPREPRWQNYVDVWSQFEIGRWLVNSLLVAAIETASVLVTSVLAGFAFARLRFWGRDGLFVLYLGAMMVPIQVTLIPSFVIVRNLGLLNSYAGIVSLHLVQFFGIFLMRQFLLNIPADLEDAAMIDGCSWLRILWQIVLPISMPAVAALVVFAFTGAWNNFLWPLVVINKPEIMTIQVGLATLRGDTTPWGLLMAATALSSLPLMALYVAFQRLFTQGIVMSGIKG